MMKRIGEKEMMEILSCMFGCRPEDLEGRVHCVPMGVVPTQAPTTKVQNDELQGHFDRTFQKNPNCDIGFDDMESMLGDIRNANSRNTPTPKEILTENDDDVNNNVDTVVENYSPIRINAKKVNGNTVIEFELAGFSKKDISVILEDENLVVTATKEIDKNAMMICEIDNQKKRVVTIGKGYTVEDFSHDFKNGILTLAFPSVKKDDTGRIQIM